MLTSSSSELDFAAQARLCSSFLELGATNRLEPRFFLTPERFCACRGFSLGGESSCLRFRALPSFGGALGLVGEAPFLGSGALGFHAVSLVREQ